MMTFSCKVKEGPKGMRPLMFMGLMGVHVVCGLLSFLDRVRGK